MPTQSKRDKQHILQRAQADGSLDSLYWFVEVDLPLRLGGKSSAVKINGAVPVVPVAPCAESSEAEAELLRWLCENEKRGSGYVFNTSLTLKSVLDDGFTWYEWGDRHQSIDNICPECGQIHTTTYEGLWSCCGWSQAIKRS